MTLFQDRIDTITRKARSYQISEGDISEAWTEARLSMNTEGSYYLDETGFSIGDSTNGEVELDCDVRNIYIDNPELEEDELMHILNDEFISIYRDIIDKYIYDHNHEAI